MDMPDSSNVDSSAASEIIDQQTYNDSNTLGESDNEGVQPYATAEPFSTAPKIEPSQNNLPDQIHAEPEVCFSWTKAWPKLTLRQEDQDSAVEDIARQVGIASRPQSVIANIEWKVYVFYLFDRLKS